ncbi:uncharacterized protein G2W53_014993 [Senna tora]|uniref:Uncharacterized protein n=1 Tax=Senna tora TaxID=362788 RepID=A0A834WUM7_9FABA|nr:uncharacterized protein G2W53_014993 [Senna tora]
MAAGHISRRRRLVAADLAGENAEVLRESEGEEASAAAEEEVFGLECEGRCAVGSFCRREARVAVVSGVKVIVLCVGCWSIE